MNNQTLAYILLGFAAYTYMNSTEEPKENWFRTPTGDVPESMLPQMGYVKFNGMWVKQTDFNAAATAAGATGSGNIDPNTQLGLDIFQILLQAGGQLATTIINNTAQQKADLIQQITTKYTTAVSTAYDANFPYTTAQLQALTVPKLKLILAGDFTIQGIQKERNLFTMATCNDGSYSSADGRGACTYHGGVRDWTRNL